MRLLTKGNLLIAALLLPLLFVSSVNAWFKVTALITCFWFLLEMLSHRNNQNSNDNFKKKLITVFAYILLASACLSIATSLSKIISNNADFWPRFSWFFQLLSNHQPLLLNISWLNDLSLDQYLPMYLLGIAAMVIWLIRNDTAILKQEEKLSGKTSKTKFWAFIETFPLFIVGFLLYEAYSWISIQPPQIMPLSTNISDTSLALNNVTFFMQFITSWLVIFLIALCLYGLYSNFGMKSKYTKKVFILVALLYAFAFLYLDAGGTQLPANTDAYYLVKDNPKLIQILPNYVDKNCNITVGNFNALNALVNYPNAEQFISGLKIHMPEAQVMKMCQKNKVN